MTDSLPLGSVSADGSAFRPAQYAGLSIDFAAMKEISALMERIKADEDVGKQKLRITV